MALVVQEQSGLKVNFNDEEAGRVVGYIHPSGSLLILTEVRNESNLVGNYSQDYAYSPNGWLDASGDYVSGAADEVLAKIL